MANVNRSLGAAAGIWLEHNDSMPERESGWLQCYVEDNQEALDMTLQAFRIAEDHRVMLPVMICLDGFVLSHTVEKVDVPDQALVDAFLPRFVPMNVLDPDDPVVMNPICPPEYATEMRYQLDRAIDAAKDVIKEVGIDFAQALRPYPRRPAGPVPDGRGGVRRIGDRNGGHHITSGGGPVEGGREEGGVDPASLHAAIPQGGTAQSGHRGSRPWGCSTVPWPSTRYGPVFTEVRNALYGSQLPITDHIAGLGGRDLTPEVLVKVFQVGRGQRGQDARTRRLLA